MRLGILVFMLSLSFLPATGYSSGVTPEAILSGKYAKELFPEQFEYTKNIENYKQATKVRETIYRKLDSLASFEMLPLWPEEEQQKFGRIIKLAKNDISGDVYTYMKELGADYAFTLNKVTNLNDIYILERAIIKEENKIKELEKWAAQVAEVVEYFYQDFINDRLVDKNLFAYLTVLSVDRDIQRLENKYQNNIGLLLLENEQEARGLYLMWKSRKNVVKQSPQREFLFMQLEKRFTRTFKE